MLRVETSGKSVEEATTKALAQLGLDQSQVDVEVVSEGRGGILGVGAQPARVIVTPRPGVMATGGRAPQDDEADDDDDAPFDDDEDGGVVSPVQVAPRPLPRAGGARGGGGRAPAMPNRADPPRPTPIARAARALPSLTADTSDPVAVAVETLEHMLDLLGIAATVAARPPQTDGDGTVDAVLDVEGDDLGVLIGRRGETLAALQYIVNLMLNRRVPNRASVAIDVEGYRRRREESLRALATRMAERVASSGQSITLEPMPPNERRIVHITLADHPSVLTVSIGEGDARKVAITPRR